MHTSYLEWAIIVFIIGGNCLFGFSHRGGQPGKHGALGRKISKLELRVGAVDVQVSALAKVGHLEGQMAELENNAAKGDDIKRLEQTVAELQRKVAGGRGPGRPACRRGAHAPPGRSSLRFHR
jgi:hypothetical protein